MYAIHTSTAKINGEKVQTFSREISNGGAELTVEAGTTGFRECADREHGARAYLSVACDCGDFYFSPIMDEDCDRPVGFEMACCGNAGLDALVKALNFSLKALVDQIQDEDE